MSALASMVTKRCSVCGKTFIPERSRWRICGPACKAIAKRVHNEVVVTSDEDMAILALYERPKTRGDCLPGGFNEPLETTFSHGIQMAINRKCPFVSCRHHLAIDISARGTVQENANTEDMDETCSLDLADRGFHKLEEIASALHITKERVRQVEVKGVSHVRRQVYLRSRRWHVPMDEILAAPDPKGSPDDLL